MLSTEQLERLTKIEYSNDCPVRYIRMMASEILKLRQELENSEASKMEEQAMQWSKDIDWNLDI